MAYENHSGLVSELSESDFKELLEELVTDMFIKVGIELIGYKYIDNEYGEAISQNRLIRKKEFFKLYGYDDGDSLLSNEFLENMYSRIMDDAMAIVRRLKGKKHIIPGNHDGGMKTELYKKEPSIVEIEGAKYIWYKGRQYYLSHFPSITADPKVEKPKDWIINFFGHTLQRKVL